MKIEQFLDKNSCILERLSENYADNKKILESILAAVQEVQMDDVPKLKNYKDLSFKESSNNNQQEAYQQFKKLQNQIEKWPDDIQSALLSVATLNWNGYIREQAFSRLATYRRRLFNMPFLLKGCLDPVIQVRNAAVAAIYRLNAEIAKSSPEQLLIFDKITEKSWFPNEFQRVFCISYLNQANLDQRCAYLSSLHDNEKASFLWKYLSNTWELRAKFDNFSHAGLFHLGQHSKFFRVYCESFIYMPIELLAGYATAILRLPSIYIRFFLINALRQLENNKTDQIYWDFFISCLLHDDAEVKRLASLALNYKNLRL